MFLATRRSLAGDAADWQIQPADDPCTFAVWTSLLVRTTSWMVLLQEQGVVNSTLVATSVIDDSNRLPRIYKQTGNLIAMVHILLSFIILPLYLVMHLIKPHYVHAARSLGASSWTVFRQFYLPQILPAWGQGRCWFAFWVLAITSPRPRQVGPAARWFQT